MDPEAPTLRDASSARFDAQGEAPMPRIPEQETPRAQESYATDHVPHPWTIQKPGDLDSTVPHAHGVGSPMNIKAQESGLSPRAKNRKRRQAAMAAGFGIGFFERRGAFFPLFSLCLVPFIIYDSVSGR